MIGVALAIALAPLPPGIALIEGSVPADRAPDGNSVFIDAPDGLILVDTGRHPDHRDKLLAHAAARRLPIAAIVNTHWHLDHTTGNHDVRQVYPGAHVHSTTAIEGALVGFLGRNREAADRQLADPAVPTVRKAEIIRGRLTIENPDRLRPTRPVTASGPVRIAGRALEFHVAPYATTEADLWIYDPATRTAIVGDLVVDIVPFMDTACVDGWQAALGRIAATPFVTLIPGHGRPMDRTAFLEWKTAFDRLVNCGRSARPVAQCADGWVADARRFVPAAIEADVRESAAAYLTARMRSSAAERERFCKPLGAPQS